MHERETLLGLDPDLFVWTTVVPVACFFFLTYPIGWGIGVVVWGLFYLLARKIVQPAMEEGNLTLSGLLASLMRE